VAKKPGLGQRRWVIPGGGRVPVTRLSHSPAAASHPQPTEGPRHGNCAARGLGWEGHPPARAPRPEHEPREGSLSVSPGWGALSDQAPKVNTWCWVFCTYFPPNLCSPPTCIHTLGPSLCSPVTDALWDSRWHSFAFKLMLGFCVCEPWQFPKSMACPRQRRPLTLCLRADVCCQDCHAAWGWAPVSAWPAQVLCSARSAPLSEGVASGSFPPDCGPPHTPSFLFSYLFDQKYFDF